jgi:hypothetical protein
MGGTCQIEVDIDVKKNRKKRWRRWTHLAVEMN